MLTATQVSEKLNFLSNAAVDHYPDRSSQKYAAGAHFSPNYFLYIYFSSSDNMA